MFRPARLFSSSAFLLLLFLLLSVPVSAASSKSGVINDDSVNIRELPTTDATVLKTLPKGAKLTVLKVTGDWTKIQYDTITGWVYTPFITVKAPVTSKTTTKETVKTNATITAEGVNLRADSNLSSDVVTTLDKGSKVGIISKGEEWCKIKTSGGTIGYVYSKFVSSGSSRGKVDSISELIPKEEPKTQEKDEVQNDEKQKETQEEPEKEPETTHSRAKVITYAKKFLGVKYVYGGSSPKGFDCSGFVQYVYDHFGVNLERTAADQAKGGKKVSKSDLEPGDIVFFDTNGGHNRINHAGIYVGDGNFIHASSGGSKRKVVISDLSSGFYANAYMTARRY